MIFAVVDFISGRKDIYLFEKKKNEIILAKTVNGWKGDSLGLKVSKLIISLDVKQLSSCVIQLPSSDKFRIKESISEKIGNYNGDLAYDFKVDKESDEELSISVVYAKKSYLDSVLFELKNIKSNPDVITSIDFLAAALPKKAKTGLSRPDIIISDLTMPVINLLDRQDISSAKKCFVNEKHKIFYIFAIAVFCFSLFKFLRWPQSTVGFNHQPRKAYYIFTPQVYLLDDIYRINTHLKEANSKKRFSNNIPLASFLSFVSSLDKQELKFVEITINKDSVIFKGQSHTLKNIPDLLEQLKNKFYDVEVIEAKNVNSGNIFIVKAKGFKLE